MSVRRIVGSIATVAATRGLGLVLALAISILLAGRLGAGTSTDAFFFARRLTTGLTEALSRVVGIVYIPGLVTALRSEKLGEVSLLWRRQLFQVVSLSLAGAVICALAAPLIVAGLAPGMEDERAALAIRLLRILVFLIPAGLFLAVSKSLLNAGRRFATPALMSLMPRILLVSCLLLFVPPLGVQFLGWALLAGSILAGAILLVVLSRQLPSMKKEGAVEAVAGAKDSGGRLWPSLLMHGYGQGIVWIDLAFASTVGAGGVSVLEYGTRLMSILPGLLSSSMLTVMYTEYSHHALDGAGRSMLRSLMRTTRGGLFILLPLVGLIVLLASDIVGLLLFRGAFDAEAAGLTVSVMQLLAPAMVLSFAANNLMSGLYADVTAPRMRILAITFSGSLICRVIAVSLLIGPLGIGGVALGNSLGSLCTLFLLYPQLGRCWGAFVTRSDIRNLAAIAAATAAALALVAYLRKLLGLPVESGTLVEAAALIGYGVLGAAVFFAGAALLRVKEISSGVDLLRRMRG